MPCFESCLTSKAIASILGYIRDKRVSLDARQRVPTASFRQAKPPLCKSRPKSPAPRAAISRRPLLSQRNFAVPLTTDPGTLAECIVIPPQKSSQSPNLRNKAVRFLKTKGN
jgi:hypothetical protein